MSYTSNPTHMTATTLAAKHKLPPQWSPALESFVGSNPNASLDQLSAFVDISPFHSPNENPSLLLTVAARYPHIAEKGPSEFFNTLASEFKKDSVANVDTSEFALNIIKDGHQETILLQRPTEDGKVGIMLLGLALVGLPLPEFARELIHYTPDDAPELHDQLVTLPSLVNASVTNKQLHIFIETAIHPLEQPEWDVIVGNDTPQIDIPSDSDLGFTIE